MNCLHDVFITIHLHSYGAFCNHSRSFGAFGRKMKVYLNKMRGERIQRSFVGWKDAFWSWLGAFSGMALICWLSAGWLSNELLIVSSFGATSVLIYAAPESPFAQPSHVLFGSMLSALVGVVCYQWLGASPLAMVLAVSLSILVMQLTHTVHPPGAAAALTAVAGGENVHQLGWLFPLFPIGAGCIIMLSVAILINNLARHRRYPRYW